MKRRPAGAAAEAFETVRTVGLALPDVEAATRYDGSPVRDALRDLRSVAWRLTVAKTRRRRQPAGRR